jgi:molecular chaperone GrpE
MGESEREAMSPEREVTAQSDSAAEETDAHRLRAMVDEARTQADEQRSTAEEYLNMLQRVQADFVNYKRRVESEREIQAEAVRAETIRSFLPVVDDLERALAHVPPEAARDGWAQGFSLIERNLAAAFERLGLRRVGAEGEAFDPNVHEAVAYEEHPLQPEGHVAAVMRPGYQLGERVVRPAQVSVARAPAQQHASKWPRHKGGRGHGNGGVEPADLQQPRGIERA